MHVIVRQGNGEYYVSAVFGFFNEGSENDGFGKYLIVFNQEKNMLVKQYMYNHDKKPYYDLMTLWLDDRKDNWVLENDRYGCVDFVSKEELTELANGKELPEDMLKKCLDIDSQFEYSEFNEIKTEFDIERLMLLSGDFHDACILELEKIDEETLRLELTGIWGCNIELYFKGNVSYCVDSRDEECSYWFGASMFMQNGTITFVDSDEIELSQVNDNFCWFKANQVIYRVIPE